MTILFNEISAKECAITTYELQWKVHPYREFLNRAKMHELGASQFSFYHAVEAFPRMLAMLASKIVRNENRKLIVDNLYEEHGAGDEAGFHTLSFKKFLTALGMDISKLYDDTSVLFNPSPSRWVRGVAQFIKSNSAAEAAAYLAGIEYLYAGISADIAQAVIKHPLLNEQAHYTVHAELDWEHGAELAMVAVMLKNCPAQIAEEGPCSNADLVQAFNKGMAQFMELYTAMLIPVEEDILPLASMPISFFFTREDPAFTGALTQWLAKTTKKVNATVIASGGETVAALLNTQQRLATSEPTVALVDMNERQRELCKAKFSYAAASHYFRKYDIRVLPAQYVETEGKFEALFALLRRFMGDYATTVKGYISGNYHPLRSAQPTFLSQVFPHEANAKLRFVLNHLFSNHFLSIVFTDQATAYTSESFAEHFYKVFLKLSMKVEGFGAQNFNNVFANKPISYAMPQGLAPDSSIKFTEFASMQNALAEQEDCNYVDMSNIGDWMPASEFATLLAQAHQACTHVQGAPDKDKVGMVVVRKLLGDYSLVDMVKQAGFSTVIQCTDPRSPFYDHSEFYSEVVVGITQPNITL